MGERMARTNWVMIAGDLIVQRGTSHRWRNPSKREPCRFDMSMIETHPVEIDGRVLLDTLN